MKLGGIQLYYGDERYDEARCSDSMISLMENGEEKQFPVDIKCEFFR